AAPGEHASGNARRAPKQRAAEAQTSDAFLSDNGSRADSAAAQDVAADRHLPDRFNGENVSALVGRASDERAPDRDIADRSERLNLARAPADADDIVADSYRSHRAEAENGSAVEPGTA